MLGWSASLWSFTRYTASQVFAGKFAWFLLLALVMFCTLVVVNAVQEEVPPNAATTALSTRSMFAWVVARR